MSNKKNSPKLTLKQRQAVVKIAKDEWGGMDEVVIQNPPQLDPHFEGKNLLGVWVQAWVFVHGKELK